MDEMVDSKAAFLGKTAAFHGLLGFIVAAAIAVAVGSAKGAFPDDPQALGRASGPAVLLGVLISLGASYLWQRRLRLAASLVALLMGLAVAGLALIIFAPEDATPTALTTHDQADLEPFERDGQAWLRHPSLPVSIRTPSADFAVAADVGRQTFGAIGASGHGSGWRHKDDQPVFALGVIGVGAPDFETVMTGIVDGVWSGLSSKAEAHDMPTAVTRREISPARATLDGTVASSLHVRLDLRPLSHRGRYFVVGGVATGFDEALVGQLAEDWRVGTP